MDCHFLLQGTLLAQGPNLHLLHWRADSLPRSHHRRPFPNWLSIKFSKPTWWSRSCYYPCAVNKEGGVESIRFFFFFLEIMELVGGRVRSLPLAVIIWYPSQPRSGGPHLPGASWGGTGRNTAAFCKSFISACSAGTRPPFPTCTPCVRWKEWAEVSPVIRGLLSNCPSLWPAARSPALVRVVFLWGMHKVEVTRVTSVLALWVLSEKTQNPRLYFPRETL